jgi:ATP-dependent RNA circularization protein (DNA/RNA ligase family)
MFRKYEKTYRIVVPQVSIEGKFSISKDDAKALLNGEVVVEEKLDGANTGIIKHKQGFSLQKRGSLVGQSEHAQFQYFHNWASFQNYEKLMRLPNNTTIYGELMYACHTVFYNKLPDYFLVFDVYNKNKDRWMDRDERDDFCNKYELHQVPLINKGYFHLEELFPMIPDVSNYGEEPAEGIVIKRYTKKGYTRTKLVRAEFVKRLEESEHWTHYNLKVNQLESK